MRSSRERNHRTGAGLLSARASAPACALGAAARCQARGETVQLQQVMAWLRQLLTGHGHALTTSTVVGATEILVRD